ncbi:MAG: hypothetical protein ACE5HW_00300, partial [Candidatus Methanofastidiosia archaeon]
MREKEIFREIWKIPRIERISNYRWWWWFWVVFIENQNKAEKPKQLTVIWSTRDSKITRVGELEFMKEDEIKRTKRRDEFGGLVAAWYFDGERMHQDFVKRYSKIVIERNSRGGKLSVPYSLHEFSGENGCYTLRLKRKDLDFKLNFSKPKNRISTPVLKDHTFFRNLKYNILKLNRMNMKGEMKYGNSREEIRGTAYFQRVCINTPIFPWFWNVLHFKDGSILKYFFPVLSTSIFRKNMRDSLKWHERFFYPLKREMEFHSALDDVIYLFKRGKIKKEISDGYPVFKVFFENERESLEAEIFCYSRAFHPITT